MPFCLVVELYERVGVWKLKNGGVMKSVIQVVEFHHVDQYQK